VSAKVWAWEQITGEHGRSNYELNALAAGFWHASDQDVLRPYVARYFSDVPASVRRAMVDADSQLREALASRAAFG
jgi:aminopeptidase N